MTAIPGFRPHFRHVKSNPPQRPIIKTPEPNECGGLAYFADTSGCGFYRIFWPQMLLRSRNGLQLLESNVIIPNTEWYSKMNFIKIQRQVSPDQLKGVQFLRKVCDKFGMRLIYEIDDLPFYEDIPKYNRHHTAYADPKLAESVRSIMNTCDEIVTTTPFFKGYLQSKLQNQNVTVVPNFVPKFWLGNYYNENDIRVNYNKNNKKPRILYPGSGAHYSGDPNIADDFTHLVDLVKKTHKEFQWVFFGGAPRQIVDLIRSGKVEYHPWVDTMSCPEKLHSLKPNVIIAPLVDNNFNRCKSDIKFTEACAMGIPSVCQDLITYKNAFNKFTTADDLYQQLKRITRDANVYMKESRKARQYMQGNFMEDRLNVWEESLTFRYGSDKRVELKKYQNYE
jgi:hypothetical protein